jgi:REP-associated tyrosine transposase
MESDGRKRPVHLPPNERHNTAVIIYVTVCTKGRRKILADPVIHKWLREAWQVKTWWLVGRYMIMPDHVHFFCAPGEIQAPLLAKWMKFWKSHSARRWPRADQTPVWQREAWDTQLRQHEGYAAKWAYIEMNPVRAGLVQKPEEWPYQRTLNELRW